MGGVVLTAEDWMLEVLASSMGWVAGLFVVLFVFHTLARRGVIGPRDIESTDLTAAMRKNRRKDVQS
jgi:hypothetical protein